MKRIISIATATVVLAVALSHAPAENIDPGDDGSQYAYAENVGWLNFQPDIGDGVHVSETQLTGHVWAENIGWVNLDPCYGGVTNDGAGNLSGYAWAENVGWISFSCENTDTCAAVDYGVTIDSDGNFDGWAWAENIGWVRFDADKAYNVKVCVVGMADLIALTADWLDESDPTVNLDRVGSVDLEDFAILASYWLSYCPDPWPL